MLKNPRMCELISDHSSEVFKTKNVRLREPEKAKENHLGKIDTRNFTFNSNINNHKAKRNDPSTSKKFAIASNLNKKNNSASVLEHSLMESYEREICNNAKSVFHGPVSTDKSARNCQLTLLPEKTTFYRNSKSSSSTPKSSSSRSDYTTKKPTFLGSVRKLNPKPKSWETFGGKKHPSKSYSCNINPRNNWLAKTYLAISSHSTSSSSGSKHQDRKKRIVFQFKNTPDQLDFPINSDDSKMPLNQKVCREFYSMYDYNSSQNNITSNFSEKYEPFHMRSFNIDNRHDQSKSLIANTESSIIRFDSVTKKSSLKDHPKYLDSRYNSAKLNGVSFQHEGEQASDTCRNLEPICSRSISGDFKIIPPHHSL
jgi:hypothetical protein